MNFSIDRGKFLREYWVETSYLKYSFAGDLMSPQGMEELSDVELSHVFAQYFVFHSLSQEFHGSSEDRLLPK